MGGWTYATCQPLRCAPCQWKQRRPSCATATAVARTNGERIRYDSCKPEGTQRHVETVHEDSSQWSAPRTRAPSRRQPETRAWAYAGCELTKRQDTLSRNCWLG